jgi:energy-coupling factor transporter transmembrane protein EcfT
MAMEARCYHGGEGPPRLRVLKCEERDYWACLWVAVLILGVALVNRLF